MYVFLKKKTVFKLFASWTFIIFILASFVLLQLQYYTTDVTNKGPLLPFERYNYMTTEDTVYEIGDEVDTVPAYFRTDFASIPKLLWFIDAPYRAEYVYASIWHDYRYSCPGELTRKDIDDIFYSLLIAENASTWSAIKMYIAVRIFGEKHFFNGGYCDEHIYKEIEEDNEYANKEL